jgi:hypothetical protein
MRKRKRKRKTKYGTNEKLLTTRGREKLNQIMAKLRRSNINSANEIRRLRNLLESHGIEINKPLNLTIIPFKKN